MAGKPRVVHAPAQVTAKTMFAFGNVAPEGAIISWKYIHCAGFDDVCKSCGFVLRYVKLSARQRALSEQYKCRECGHNENERLFHHFANIRCTCPPGPHALTLLTKAKEIGSAGGRGSGKSEDGFALSVRGNMDEVFAAQQANIEPDPVDVSYINSPDYRFLVIRKNSKDLKDFWHRAKTFYANFGASFNDSEMIIRFPSGAEGIGDHLATEDAFEKYQGQQFQFIWVEEATQVADETLYIKVKQSCRSANLKIKEKLFLPANPGGPGGSWYKTRFVDVAPPGEVYTEPYTGETRIFIHSTVYDNPYFLRENASYLRSLQSIGDENLKKKWLHGDFDVLDGQFFTEFRDKQRPGEPPEALHVVPAQSIDLLPHWRRWIAMDWGFSHDAAVAWGCYATDQRIYTYRESVESRIGTREWGVRIARMSMADLNGLPDHHMTLFLSPDAFARRDDAHTPAEQIALGIAEVLGTGSVFVVDFTDQEKAMPSELAWESLKRRKHMQQHVTSITIQRAANHRISGWALMRDKLRWWPLVPVEETEMNPRIAEELLSTKGVMAYIEYKKQLEAMRAEVLPKWRILDCCPEMIKAMMAVQHEEGTEDVLDQGKRANDCADALRYLQMSFVDVQNAVPERTFVQQRVEQFSGPGYSEHSRTMVADHAAAQYQKTQTAFKGLMLPRATGRHKRGAVLVH